MSSHTAVPENLMPKKPHLPEPKEAIVAPLRGRRIRIKVGNDVGVLMVAGISREALYDELVAGLKIPVLPMGPGGRGETNYTCKGLIKGPWQRIAEEFTIGDIVRGRVVKVNDTYALVELLPEAAGLVPFKEIEFDPKGSAKDLLKVGEVVSVKILSLNPAAGKANLSIRQAFGNPAKGRIALIPGGRPFPREAGEDGIGRRESEAPASIDADGDRIAAEAKALRSKLAVALKELRAARAKVEAFSKASDSAADATASARSFLRAVRIAYATDFDEGDRTRYPLRRMQVGREFLDRIRTLDGVPIEKIIEVCAQVASGRAKDMPSRKVHRAGHGGSGGAERPSDHARAWRCSLQDGTPGARRLHWWDVPATGGGIVEFASVGHHDDFDVPE